MTTVQGFAEKSIWVCDTKAPNAMYPAKHPNNTCKSRVFIFERLLDSEAQERMMNGYYLAILVTCFCIAVLFLKSRNQRSKLVPPGPWNLPVIGSLHLLGKLPHVSLKRLSDKHGEIMYMKLGSVPFIVFSSASMAKEIFGVHSLEFASKRKTIAGKCLGNDFSGLVYSMYTSEYNLQKKVLVTHLLSAAKLRLYEDARRKEQIEMVASIFEGSYKPLEVRERLHILNMNIITVMLFGEKYSGSSMANTVNFNDFVNVVTEALRMSGYFNISDYVPSIRWMDVQGIERRLRSIMSLINSHIQKIIDEHRITMKDHAGRPQCFVDVLLSLEGNEKLSDVSIITLIFDVLLGAVDTSALSTEWAMTELLRHPSKLNRAQLEIEKVVGNKRLVKESDLANLPYVDAIAKETSRLHPLAPIALNREVMSTCTIKGYEIPSGMGAIINLGAILLDGSRWDKPLEFNPERFIEADIDIFGMSYDLVPFGVGRRMCPGAKLGYDTLRLAIATMVQGFNWEVPGGANSIDMAETYGLVCHKTQPLVAIPTPRLPPTVYKCY